VNRRNFVKHAIAASAAVAAAPVVANEMSRREAAKQLHHGMLYGGARAGGFSHPWPHPLAGRGGKSIYGDLMLQHWMETADVGSGFFIARGNGHMSIKKTSATTFEMSVIKA
jgi:hypothetical protein